MSLTARPKGSEKISESVSFQCFLVSFCFFTAPFLKYLEYPFGINLLAISFCIIFDLRVFKTCGQHLSSWR